MRGFTSLLVCTITIVACGGDDDGDTQGTASTTLTTAATSEGSSSSDASTSTSSGSEESSSTAIADSSSSEASSSSGDTPEDPEYPAPDGGACPDDFAPIELPGGSVCAPFCVGADAPCPAPASGDAAPVCTPFEGKGGSVVVDTDEAPSRAKPEKIRELKPAFAKDGTVTAANASSISDGAAALVVTRESVAKKNKLPIVAKIVATAVHAHEPAKFGTAPVPAMKKVLAKAGWSVGDVDLFEVNEAFAVVAMVAASDLHIPADKLNVNGGACALGHPIGASGARVIATLLGALENRKLKRGVASLCIGGGEATAVALELA